MMKINRCMVMAGMAALISLSANTVQAQDRPDRGRGNFDPAQMRERRMEALKDRLEIKDDTEWKALQPLIQKVMDVQQQMFTDRIRSEFRSGSNRGGDRGGGPENRTGDTSGDQGRRSRGPFGGGEPSAEAQALEKAIEAKASNSELKTAIAKLQESRKTKQSELEKAQTDLRKVLSVRQEAILTSSGLL